MRFPGAFIQESDFPNNIVALSRNNMGTVYGDAQGDITTFRRSTSNTNLFPAHLRWSMPFTSYALKARVETDILYRMEKGPSYFGWNKEDVIARLSSNWAAYSPVTVEMLNTYFNDWPSQYKLDKHKREFINQHSVVKYSKCKVTKLFVPTKMKTSVYNVNIDGFVLQYWYYQNSFMALKNDLIMEVTRVATERARYTEQQRGNNLLKNYSEKATNYFNFQEDAKDHSNMFYGIELEYEGRTSDNLLKTSQLIPHAILKRDGSVYDGFEICTAPAHHAVHAEKFKPFFDHLPSLGLEARDNTGMHVHMSKNACSFLQLGKIFALTNKDVNEEFMVKIAGRAANHFCQHDHLRDNKISYPFKGAGNFSRYSRVNFMNNDTFELRMFSTPMTYQNFMQKMEFCKSLFDFTSMSSVSVKDADDLNVFLNYVKVNKSDYPHFMTFIKETI